MLSKSQRSDEASWSRWRWLSWVTVIFAVQVALIFLLSDRKPVSVRQPSAVPELSLTTLSSELLELDDPTLFALPHANGFSGAAWMQSPRVEAAPLRWTEPPQWLSMPAGQFASAFVDFMQTNRFPRFSLELKPAPQLIKLERSPTRASPAAASSVRVEGNLTGRAIANPPVLAAQPAADMLANTVVQVIVDSDGKVFSAILLPPGSGAKDVDQSALNIAKSTRFKPLPPETLNASESTGWTRGRMIFQWRSEPVTQTNLPPANP